MLPSGEFERIQNLAFDDAGHGFDAFGANPDWVAMMVGLLTPLYDRWFRVKSYDAHHIPTNSGAIVACNHSGTLPFDGTMLFIDIVRNTNPPRLPRPVADVFVPMLPFVGMAFSRAGVVSGSRSNVARLLEAGELLMIFPEGTPGISKPFEKRYQLQDWRVGHCELAIRHGVPIVPVGIVGAEEQMPQLARIPWIKLFGAPFLPIPATPFPLPVRYHVLYGRPIDVHVRYRPEQADDPAVLQEAALEVKNAVRGLLQRGLSERTGIFA